jgi:hypothetical protein
MKWAFIEGTGQLSERGASGAERTAEDKASALKKSVEGAIIEVFLRLAVKIGVLK